MSVLAMIRGDTEPFLATITNPDGTAFNLTSAKIWFSARHQSPDSPYVFQKTTESGEGIVVADSASGIALITMANADTAGLPDEEVTLEWDLQVKTVDNSIFTPARGTLVISSDVTTETT